MSKILLTATNAMVYHFLIPHINKLLENGHSVVLACTHLDGYDELLKSKISDQVELNYVRLNRSPFCLENFKGIFDLIEIINSNYYDLIWTNEPVMSIATRIAARKARKHGTIVAYMVHGFHFFKGSSFVSWLIYYPIERIMAYRTDELITINKEDYKRGKVFAYKNVSYIHGIGIDTKKFSNSKVRKVKIREEIGIPDTGIMLLSVGELSARKNHEVVIRALAKLNDQKIHYVICGEGVLFQYLSDLCKELGLNGNVHLLGYRKDIAELCKSADIYVFPSQREGLGIAALEGMAAGLPLISSYINGIRDYTENQKTGYVLKPHDVEGFASAIKTLSYDSALQSQFGQYNQEKAKLFDINNSVEEVYRIIQNYLA